MKKWYWISAGAILLVIILFRVVLPFQDVFTAYGTQINTVDGYYVTRYADAFPDKLTYDYFINFPDGMPLLTSHTLFQTILGFLASVFHTDAAMVGAILSPILFILTLLVVFVITQTLFKNKVISFIAVGLLAVMPGEIFHRTMLGAADYHCAEILIMSLFAMFCLLTINSKGWYGRLGFGLLGLITLLVYSPVWAGWPIALLILVLTAYCYLIIRTLKWWKLGIIGFTGLVILRLFIFGLPEWAKYGFSNVVGLFTINASQLITEEYPLFFTSGWFDFSTIFNFFGVTLFIALIGVGMLIYQVVKYRRGSVLFLLVWTLVMLALTLARRRFDYYFAINVAILTAYVVVVLVKHFATTKAVLIKTIVLLSIVIALPLVRAGYQQATSAQGIMPIGWQETTRWLMEPSGDNEKAYKTGSKYDYGILSWRDYGYWLVGVSHMPVLCSPGNGDDKLAAQLLTSTDIQATKQKLQELSLRFVVIDEDMVTKKLYPIYVTTQGSLGDLSLYKDHLNYPNRLSAEDVRQSLMYRLFYGNVDGFGLVFESSDKKVKVFGVW